MILQTRKAAQQNPASIINKLIEGNLDKIDAKTAFDAARQDDATGKEVVERYTKYLAEGIINVINIFQPEVIAIGGGVSKEGEYLLKPIREIASRYVYSRDIPQARIETALMGNDAGIVGAAMLGK